MVIKILILGFGRMGLSHALQMLGVLRGRGKTCEVYIVDTSVLSRLLARMLIRQARVIILSEKKLSRLPDKFFDYAVDASPPATRARSISMLSRLAVYFLVEKPVVYSLPENAMSGYVLQHGPLVPDLRLLLDESLSKVTITLETNLSFANQYSWRAGSFGGVVNEFLGHMLSVPFAVFPGFKAFDDLDVKSAEEKKLNVCLTAESGPDLDLCLAYDQNVRKTTYSWLFEGGASPAILYDGYSIQYEDGERSSAVKTLPKSGVTCEYYLRGFDFCNQSVALLDHSGDVMNKAQLDLVENLLTLVNEEQQSCE